MKKMIQKLNDKKLKLSAGTLAVALILGLCLWLLPSSVLADGQINLMINGQRIDQSPGPQLIQGRTLVPVRVISESLGANVTWDPQARTVLVEKDGRSVLLTINSHVVAYSSASSGSSVSNDYDVIDVPPRIIDSRTFVPLRLISNALGADIDWQSRTRTVTVNSAQNPLTPFSDLKISTPWKNQTVLGKTELRISYGSSMAMDNAAEIRYLLLDPATRKGFVIARGTTPGNNYQWLPETSQNGSRLLVAAVYDNQNQLIAGDVIPVTVSVQPQISLRGISENQVITQVPVSVSADINFSPKFVRYDLTNLDTGKVTSSGQADPFGPYSWRPMADDNGRFAVTVTAVDHNGTEYPGTRTEFELAVERTLSLGGVRSGLSINSPVSLSAVRNFEVSQTQYWKRNTVTDQHTMIAQTGFAAHTWFPGPEEQGSYELYVRVLDTRLRPYTSAPVPVTVSGTPQIRIRGTGPNQVISGELSLSVISNVEIGEVRFELGTTGGSRKTIVSGRASDGPLTWTPVSADAGKRTIRAVAQRTGGGGQLVSDEIPVTVYLGQMYRARAITERDQFKGFASALALESFEKTGMSAALQTAQAILETGWGQSLPVDKYSGKFSYNLFGIKGSGPAGSVLSNTWEEYNGVAFRTDANFRAYNNVNQSWDDHKNLLLRAARYEPFRQVMHDSSQGAWALRRSGYATDSLYPIKLIDIIRIHDLKRLDEIDF